MKCPNCKIHDAIIDPMLGVLNCNECNTKKSNIGKYIEFTTEQIKQDRKEFADDLLQPFRNGELSKEYIEKHGTKNLKVSEHEAKKAKNTWGDLNYYG